MTPCPTYGRRRDAISKITGREYKPFVYYGAADAENIIVIDGVGDRDHQGDGSIT